MNMINRFCVSAGLAALCAGGAAVTDFASAQSQTQQPPTRPRPIDPVRPTDPAQQRTPDDTRRMGRFDRPFAFQSPDAEGRFKESTQMLMGLEQQLAASQQRLISKLAEARQASGEKQNQAILEVLEQLVRDHGEMHRYMVQARTAWTGDMDSLTAPSAAPGLEKRPPSQNQDPENPRNPK